MEKILGTCLDRALWFRGCGNCPCFSKCCGRDLQVWEIAVVFSWHRREPSMISESKGLDYSLRAMRSRRREIMGISAVRTTKYDRQGELPCTGDTVWRSSGCIKAAREEVRTGADSSRSWQERCCKSEQLVGDRAVQRLQKNCNSCLTANAHSPSQYGTNFRMEIWCRVDGQIHGDRGTYFPLSYPTWKRKP